MSNNKKKTVDLADVLIHTIEKNPSLGPVPTRKDLGFIASKIASYKNNDQLIQEYISILRSNRNVAVKALLLAKFAIQYKDNKKLQKMMAQERHKHMALVAQHKSKV